MRNEHNFLYKFSALQKLDSLRVWKTRDEHVKKDLAMLHQICVGYLAVQHQNFKKYSEVHS